MTAVKYPAPALGGLSNVDFSESTITGAISGFQYDPATGTFTSRNLDSAFQPLGDYADEDHSHTLREFVDIAAAVPNATAGSTFGLYRPDDSVGGAGALSLVAALPASSVSAYALTLLDDTVASAARTTLGLGTAATSNSTDFQPIDATLSALAGLDTVTGAVRQTGTDAFAKGGTVAELGITNARIVGKTSRWISFPEPQNSSLNALNQMGTGTSTDAATTIDGTGIILRRWTASNTLLTRAYMYWCMMMPKGWDGGTLSFRVPWSNTGAATASSTAVFGMTGHMLRDGDSWGAVTFANYQEVTDTYQNATRLMHISPESSAITPTGTYAAAGTMMMFSFYRDIAAAGDTFDADLYIPGVEIFYTTSAGNDA